MEKYMLTDSVNKKSMMSFLKSKRNTWVNLTSLSLTTFCLSTLNKRFSAVIFLRFEGEVCWPPRTTLPFALVRHGSCGSVMAPWSFPDTPCHWCTYFPFGSLAVWNGMAPVRDLAGLLTCCHVSWPPCLGRQI